MADVIEIPPDKASDALKKLMQAHTAEQKGFLRSAAGLLMPQGKTDTAVMTVPLLLETLGAIGAPEVTLPLAGAVDLGEAAESLVRTPVARTATSAATGAIANKLQGKSAIRGGVEAGVGNLLGEAGTGAVKMAGRGVNTLRQRVLGRATSQLAEAISDQLPLLKGSLEGKDTAPKLAKLFARQGRGGRSIAERLQGDALDPIESDIEAKLTQTQKGGLQGFNARGQAIRAPTQTVRQAIFPVHTTDATGNWRTVNMPFKDAVAVMRSRWPRGYTLTGTERDNVIADQWRKLRAADSRSISQELGKVLPQESQQWQAARKSWELAHAFGDIFNDPKAFDVGKTGEVNTQTVAKHLYGDTPTRINQKAHIAAIAGPEYADRIHGIVIHETPKPGRELPVVSDIVQEPQTMRAGVSGGPSAAPPFLHVRPHLGGLHAGFHPTGTDLPWVKERRANPLLGLIRMLGRHAGVDIGEDMFGDEDNAVK